MPYVAGWLPADRAPGDRSRAALAVRAASDHRSRDRAGLAPIDASATAALLAGHPTPAAALQLQRLAGNRAIAGLLARRVPRSAARPPVQRAGAGRKPAACATYEPGEAAASRAGGMLEPDVALAANHAIAGLDPEAVVIADFPVGSSTVRRSTVGELRGSWIDIMERQAAKKLDIVGYSDCVGEGGDNLLLRNERAWAVAGQFPKLGAQAPYVGPAPEDQFLAGNGKRDDRALNRGVVLRPPASAAPTATKRPKRDRNTPITMQEPPSEGCSANQKTQLSIAWPAAKLMAQKALDHARTDRGGVNTFLLKRYFGEDAVTHLTEIRAGYQRILDRWIDWDVNFECHAQTEGGCPSRSEHSVTMAYVKVRRFPYTRHFGDIHICEEGLKRAYNMQLLSATVLHEMSHRLDNTSDHEYCDAPGCSISTKAAIDNADSYSRYAREIFNVTM